MYFVDSSGTRSAGFAMAQEHKYPPRWLQSRDVCVSVIALSIFAAPMLASAQTAAEPAAASELPPVEVTATQKKKKVSTQSAPAAQTIEPAVQPPPAAQPQPETPFPQTVVSGPSTPGLQQIDISLEDLERSNPTDIRDVFIGEPAIAVGGSVPSNQKVYVHGVEETSLSITVDGSRQNNKVFHHNTTNLIDPALLKSARVDAGVAPADAGPGALGGSIAYETKDARDLLLPGRNVGGFATAGFDTNGDTFSRSVSGYGIHDGFEILGYLNFADGDDYEAGNGDTVIGTGADLFSAIGKLAYQGFSGDRIELSYEHVHDGAARPFRANLAGLPPNPNRPEPSTRIYDLTRQNYVLKYSDETPNGWWNPTAVLAYSITDVEIPTGVTGRFSVGFLDSKASTDSVNGKLENLFLLGHLGSITAGVDFYNDSAIYDDIFYAEAYGERVANVGAYTQARLNPTNKSRLSFGFRYDSQSFKGVESSKFNDSGFSGNVSGEYDITNFLTAKAGASHVWAGIPLAENFVMNGDGGWDYGSGPEAVTADNVTAGLAARLSKALTLEGTVFRTEIYDARSASYADALRKFDLETEGFDVSAKYAWTSGFARLKFSRVDAEIDGNSADSFFGNYLTVPVGDIFGFQVIHTFQGTGITIGGDMEIALKNSDPLSFTVDPNDPEEAKRAIPQYEVVNAFIEYKPNSMPNLTLRADVKNIFDEAYASRATYGQDFAVVDPLLEPGRSFRFSGQVRF